MLGKYPEQGLEHLGQYLPEGWEKDMELIHQPLDYYYQNIYSGMVIRHADNAQGFEVVPQAPGTPKTAIQWYITPDALYWGPRFLYERYKTPFIISENGLSCHDAVSLDGKVHDPNREDYLHRYLLAYKRAAEEGVDIRGDLFNAISAAGMQIIGLKGSEMNLEDIFLQLVNDDASASYVEEGEAENKPKKKWWGGKK